MPSKSKREKIAIACQGGGSRTAFTAGALEGSGRRRRVGAFPGCQSFRRHPAGPCVPRSSGTRCKKAMKNPTTRLMRFWEANMAQTRAERMFNRTLVDASRKVTRGAMPTISLAPDSPLIKTMMRMSSIGLRAKFTDFELLLKQHFDFDESAARGPRTSGPVLAMGASQYIERQAGGLQLAHHAGSHRIHTRLLRRAEYCSRSRIRRSGVLGWALFRQSPDYRAHASFLRRPENLPEELWVIKINQTGCDKIPRTPEEIATAAMSWSAMCLCSSSSIRWPG